MEQMGAVSVDDCFAPENYLRGSLPAIGIQRLQNIKVFALWRNQLQGILPEEGLSSLSVLEALDIQMNQFAGSIPAT
eukprot:6465694-Amphidinium_carterae.1